jgi:N-acetylglucosaminyldiphosphoundecaprenol N-acetyl-beta-D-mannosaminyltransferase
MERKTFLKKKSVDVTVNDGVPSINGKRIFQGTVSDLIDDISGCLQRPSPSLLITLNVDQFLNLRTDTDYCEAFNSASIITVDGMPIKLLLSSAGAVKINRITGADLLPILCKIAANYTQWRIAIVGASDESRNQAIANLLKDYPNLTIEGFSVPNIGNINDPKGGEIIGSLSKWEPDLVFLSLGSPKQELWFLKWKELLPRGVYLGTGAAVDFVSGYAKRASNLLQSVGLEWAFRLAQEPRRLAHRYLIKGPRFIFEFFKTLFRQQKMSPHKPDSL